MSASEARVYPGGAPSPWPYANVRLGCEVFAFLGVLSKISVTSNVCVDLTPRIKVIKPSQGILKGEVSLYH